MTEPVDDNDLILRLIEERLALGRERYGHGIRTGDDTTQWGTKADSWTEMGLEEALDLTLYLSAALVRLQRMEEEAQAIRADLRVREKELSLRESRVQDGGDGWWRRWVGRRS